MSTKIRTLLSHRIILILLSVVVITCGAFAAFRTQVSRTASASGCNSVAKGSWSNNCTVYEGNISNFVVAIQTAVNESGTKYNGHTCSTGGIDGDFGPNTFNGVECFQGAKNIGIDGIVGPQTWGKLYGLLTYDFTFQGWAYYYIGPPGAHNDDFKRWTSTGVWYVWFTKAFTFCQMNLSSPC